MSLIKTLCFSEKLTKEEGRILLNSIGMTYINNEHNRKIISEVTKEFLSCLRKNNQNQ